MSRRTKIWLTIAVLFALGNVAGAVMAIVAKEPIHATTHVVLAILSAYFVRLLAAPTPAPALPIGPELAAADERLSHLELSLEGLATGVERMRQGQRSITRIFAQRSANEHASSHRVADVANEHEELH